MIKQERRGLANLSKNLNYMKVKPLESTIQLTIEPCYFKGKNASRALHELFLNHRDDVGINFFAECSNSLNYIHYKKANSTKY